MALYCIWNSGHGAFRSEKYIYIYMYFQTFRMSSRGGHFKFQGKVRRTDLDDPGNVRGSHKQHLHLQALLQKKNGKAQLSKVWKSWVFLAALAFVAHLLHVGMSHKHLLVGLLMHDALRPGCSSSQAVCNCNTHTRTASPEPTPRLRILSHSPISQSAL